MPREFACYLTIILLADHRTGYWKGSGSILARLVHIRKQYALMILKSLHAKGYIVLPASLPAASEYRIEVCKYFESVPGGTATVSNGNRSTSLQRQTGTAQGVKREPLLLQEVRLQEEKRQEARLNSPRLYPREIRELKAKAESRVGQGPEAPMGIGKYDKLLMEIRAGTAEPTAKNIMRAKNMIRLNVHPGDTAQMEKFVEAAERKSA